HIGLVHAGELFAALPGRFKADAADTLDLVLRVGHGVHGDLLAVFLIGLVLAEVNAADEFPHHDKVDPLFHDLGFQRAGRRQLGPDFSRAAVGVEAHARAQAQQALLGALVAGQALPLGAAHRPQQHAVGSFALFQFRGGQRVAELVDGFPAHAGAGVSEGVAVFGGDLVQHAHGLGDDLGARTIPVDQGDILVHDS